jgi:phosphate transport system permease protein
MLAPVATPAVDLRAKPSWRTVKNRIMTGLMIAACVAVAVPLVAVLVTLLSKGLGAVVADFPKFFTADIPTIDEDAGPGIAPAIVGTLLVTLGASLLAIPLGVLGAIYLHEYGTDSTFARLVRFLAVVMTGVPSIVMGMFVYIVWTMQFGSDGYSAFGGSLAMACLMLPIVINSTEQMLKLVSPTLREAAYALGTSKSRTILTVVLPAALPGIVSGALLAVARAAGETAPVLFTVGAAKSVNFHLFSGANTTLSAQIYAHANAVVPPDLVGVSEVDRAWGAALTLVLLTFALMVIARLVTARLSNKK